MHIADIYQIKDSQTFNTQISYAQPICNIHKIPEQYVVSTQKKGSTVKVLSSFRTKF